jgi:lysophospholipase L1-like esterase
VVVIAWTALTAGAQAPIIAPCAPLAQGTSQLAAATNRTGLIDLYFFGADGAPVTFYECAGGRARLIGVRTATANGGQETPFYAAASWLCDRQVREFAATATPPGEPPQHGITSVSTESCARRFALQVPSRVAVGQPAAVGIVDRWQLGGTAVALCLRPPHGRRHCRRVTLPILVTAARVPIRPRRRGDWQVQLRIGPFSQRERFAVGVTPVPVRAVPTVLVTGDSTAGGVDSALADDLGARADVLSDVKPGASISGGYWTAAFASAQLAAYDPAVTVLSIGANEGFPLTSATGATLNCCSAAWTARLAGLVRGLMNIYRAGHARVIFLTIPLPLRPVAVTVTQAVNAAIVSAATGLARVQVLRMDLLFTPDGYQPAIRYRGKEVQVREPDGIHLNPAGTAIEAQRVAAVLRARL